jgi:hypothetical protein
MTLERDYRERLCDAGKSGDGMTIILKEDAARQLNELGYTAFNKTEIVAVSQRDSMSDKSGNTKPLWLDYVLIACLFGLAILAVWRWL